LPRTLWLLRLVLAHRPHLVAVVAVVAAVVAVGHLISELAASALIAAIDKEFYGRT
jgi:predicted membrane-bound spermidine synthase